MNWADRRYAIGRGLAAIRHKQGKDLQPFLKGLIDCNLPSLLVEATGSTFPNVSSQQLNQLSIQVPDLPTQRSIAAILSALDEKIELNRQTNRTLEAIAQALFKEWFVDFNYLSEPRLEGLKDYLDYDSVSLESVSTCNQVNHGSDGKLHDICELNPKLFLKKGTVAPHVEMKDLSSDSAIIKRSINREFTSGSKFQNGDTLLARITPCLENGKTGLVNFLKDGEVGWGSTEFIVMRAKGCVSPYFVYCIARQQRFRDFAIQSMVGSSGRQRVIESILSDFDVPIPNETVMKCFHAAVAPIFRQLHENEQQTTTLTAIRDTLLQKLMSGEINV